MRPFESAAGTNSVQSSALNRRAGARWALPVISVIFAGILVSVVHCSSAVGQQSQSDSGQFRKRSTTSTGTRSAIDPKLRGFLEQQAGSEHTSTRTSRTQVSSGESSPESRRNSQSSSSAVRSPRSTTSVNGSQTPDRTNSRIVSSVDETESFEAAAARVRTDSNVQSGSQPTSQSTVENAGGVITSAPEEHSSPIERTVWEPKSDTASAGSVGKVLTEFSESAAISELQPTPSSSSEQKPAETSVPLKSASESGMFLDLRDEAKPNSSSAPVGEGGAEVSIESSPMQVLSRAVAWIVIALCLFSLAALGVRRWQRQRGLLPTPGSRSRVIETLSLGPGRSVSLIEMAGHRALVAFDAGGIKQLVLTPPSFQDELTEADEPLIYERPTKTRTDLTVPASEEQT